MTKEEELLAQFTTQTEKILAAITKLHSKMLNLEKRIERIEERIEIVERRTAHVVLIH